MNSGRPQERAKAWYAIHRALLIACNLHKFGFWWIGSDAKYVSWLIWRLAWIPNCASLEQILEQIDTGAGVYCWLVWSQDQFDLLLFGQFSVCSWQVWLGVGQTWIIFLIWANILAPQISYKKGETYGRPLFPQIICHSHCIGSTYEQLQICYINRNNLFVL